MNVEEYKNEFMPFFKAISGNKIVTITERQPLKKISEDELDSRKDLLGNAIKPFYNWRNGFTVCWSPKNDDNPDIYGRINILKLENLFDDTIVKLDQPDGYTFNGNSSEKIQLKGVFRPLDYFADEACVGFFSDHGSLDELYYHDFGISFYSLKVDFEGYFKLLTKSYGYAYWPQVILNKEYNYGTDTTDRFKEDMPNLFPDFDYDKFIELYESVRIDK